MDKSTIVPLLFLAISVVALLNLKPNDNHSEMQMF